MDKDRIKAIAEEYVEQLTLKDVNTEDCVTKSGAIAFLHFLSALYCIVEREKVRALEAEISCAIMEAHDDDDMQMVAHEVLDVMPRRFAAIFGTSMFNKNEAEYTDQCKTCMRKLCGEVLEVCKDSTDENRHCQSWNHEKQDHCLYKIWWDKYPESYWRTILTPEQFNLAKSLNQDEE